MSVRYLNKVLVFSFVALIAMTNHAEAAVATKVGDVLNNLASSLGGVPSLFSDAAYLMGLFFSVAGIFKFKDHVDQSGSGGTPSVPLSAGIKRFLAGGMLFATPFMTSSLEGSFFGSGGPGIFFKSAPTTGATLSGMDQMIVEFVSNIAGPATFLLEAFAYISAIALLITGIIRLTHTAQEGPRGPAGLGTIMTFIASGGLFSFGDMIGTISNSLFGSSTVTNYPTIATTGTGAVMTVADANQVAPVIQSLMVFISIVGFIAFIRGFFVLKAFADGNGQSSLAQALTFLIGGTMAINLGALVNVLEATVNVGTITF